MKINAFKEALMLYGADLGSWPEELGKEAAALLGARGAVADELNTLIDDEMALETLLGERTFEEPGEFLAQRIIAHAEDSAPNEEPGGFFAWLFVDLFTPKAAFALVLTLVIGFMVGYMGPSARFDSFDSVELTEESFVDLLMEGDIFVE